MKLEGKLKNPNVHTYYVTGSLEKKVDNKPLQKMLQKIKEGGMNAFLNDSELGRFAQRLKSSFENDGYINKNNSLTSIGEDIVNTGKSWRSLQGAFLCTVLEYNGKAYLLNAELVKDSENFIKGDLDKKEFKDTEYADTFRNIKTDEKWADGKNQPQSTSVDFRFDYETSECEVTVKFDDERRTFKTTETCYFSLIEHDKALNLLKECEKKEGVLVFSPTDTAAVQIRVSNAEDIVELKWLQNFFDNGNFCLTANNDMFDAQIKNICLYVNNEDVKTAEMLLNKYLLDKAEKSYLGYEETGRFVNAFQELFVSPDGKNSTCPSIMKETKEVYAGLVQRAKTVAEKNPIAYLHLKAFIDLSPENTLKPYIEKESVVNFSNQHISFDTLAEKVFGNKRNIKSISALSKYTASNGRNARAFILFAESIEKHFGIRTTVITTDEISPNSNSRFKETDDKWFAKMEKSKNIRLIKKKQNEIKEIHDRYYKVIRTDDSVEWWVMTGELDSLRFENDHPRIREDIGTSNEGIAKEMTFSKIKQEGVPQNVTNIMEEK